MVYSSGPPCCLSSRAARGKRDTARGQGREREMCAIERLGRRSTCSLCFSSDRCKQTAVRCVVQGKAHGTFFFLVRACVRVRSTGVVEVLCFANYKTLWQRPGFGWCGK